MLNNKLNNQIKTMSSYRCRVCLKFKLSKYLQHLGNQSDHKTFCTLYDMLLFCVPSLVDSLKNSEYICLVCLKKLLESVKFLDQCIQSDDQIRKEKLEKLGFQCLNDDSNKNSLLVLDSGNSCATDSDDDLFTKAISFHSENEELKDKPNVTIEINYVGAANSAANNKEVQNHITCSDTNNTEEIQIQCDPSVFRALLNDKDHESTLEGNSNSDSVPFVAVASTNTQKNTSFSKKEKQISHRAKRLTSQRKYTKYKPCDDCGEKVFSKNKHMCKFICMKCKKRFICKEQLEKHIIENLEEVECTVSCPYCPLFVTSNQFEEHMKSHPTIMCEVCSKCFSSIASLKAHHSVHNDKNEKCPKCDWRFKTKSALRAHLNYVHKQKEKAVLCDLCPKKFHTNSKLSIHKRRHHYQIKQGTCAKCGKSFSDIKAVEYHDRLVHLKIKPFCCELCGKAFGRKDYMQHHTKICNGTTSESPRRGKKKQYKNIKANHPAECIYCHKVLKSIHNLKLHIKSVHTKAPRIHKCDVCGLQFAAKANLKKHAATHNDSDCRYRCDVCYKKFQSADELQDHISQKHKKKPYKCEECGEKFARRFILENHKYSTHPTAPDIKTCEEKTKAIMEEAIRHLELQTEEENESKFTVCVVSQLP